MQGPITIADIQRALDARDPDLPRLIIDLAEVPDPEPEQPVREGALTLPRLKLQFQGAEYRDMTPEKKAAFRRNSWKRLESPEAEVPLPERLQLYAVIMDLWQQDGPYERRCLLAVIAEVPLVWGPWRALKTIFKEAETKGDDEVWGALAARFDTFRAGYETSSEVSRNTLGYLCRRAWRRLRRIAESRPFAYADMAVEVLRFYPETTNWSETWIANHIFHHHTRAYGRTGFRLSRKQGNALKDHAYPQLWRRTPRPLLTLLERALAEKPLNFAATLLKEAFRHDLREIDVAWVIRLLRVSHALRDEFVVWLLKNMPRFDPATFRETGLHEPLFRLFASISHHARTYVLNYARTHARDLPLPLLLRMVAMPNDAVNNFALELIRERDPRKEIGLEAWGMLLANDKGAELAAEALRRHFGAGELTLNWFTERLLDPATTAFARKHLGEVHKKPAPTFFYPLFDEPRCTQSLADWGRGCLAKYKTEELDPAFLKRLLLNPLTTGAVSQELLLGTLENRLLGLDFLKVVAFHPAWANDPWFIDLTTTGPRWARDLKPSDELSAIVFQCLADVRRFEPAELGFDWLMMLLQRGEPLYHKFARDAIIKSFAPADFAADADEQDRETDDAINIDLQGASILFTGKLKTMTRSEAQKKLVAANGKKASGVSKSLDYLVIGDEGSPLYDMGRKGSKQVKAESLIAAGAPIKIISETAFLRMLSGKQAGGSAEATQKGCERIWSMAVDAKSQDTGMFRFALAYLRRRHPDISMELTDRPVDPGTEIPQSFLTWERVKPLFFDRRMPLRDLALDYARWELARWSPSPADLLKLVTGPYGKVKDFFIKAIFADESGEHKRYRIAPETWDADAVFPLLEAKNAAARDVGIRLMRRDPKLVQPEAVFRLTESPDRNILSFAVSMFWQQYRDKGITRDHQSTGAEKHRTPPGESESMRDFLRRILLRIPPPRFGKGESALTGYVSARKVKLRLIEVMRDLALHDEAFAALVAPLFAEMLGSHGQSEKAACLVALTRIGHCFPTLKSLREVPA
ncbi:MAG: BRCT domain-containing protein [Acidobacteriota bacterium]|nr:BRCT domain-containing protein [Acidobacteriota bacterium]